MTMKAKVSRIAHVSAAALLLLAAAAPHRAAAQDTQKDEGFFGKPAFVLMPSVVIAPVFSGIGSGDKGPTKAYFNARFMTVVPTASPYFQLVAGAQFLPNGPHDEFSRNNAPTLFYGGIIPLAFLTKATNGFFSLSVDPLAVYALGGGGGDRDFYGHEFVLEGAVVANIGQKMFTNMGFFSSTSAFFLLDQQLTHTRFFDENGKEQHDYWAPAIVTGITIPIGR
jgi:hypothetical protein